MTDTTRDPRFEGLPLTWSANACETYCQIESDLDYASPATLAVLFEACSLIARADALDALVEEEGFMIEGYRQNRVLHPAISEARLARQSAMTHLRALGVAPGQSSSSSAGAALASKRWHSSESRRKSS